MAEYDSEESTKTFHTEGLFRDSSSGYRLKVLSGPNEGRALESDRYVVKIGRSEQTDLELDDRGVSSFHCAIRYRDGSAWIKDLDSSNGTVLNGETIDEVRRLREGDVIALGEETMIRFTIFESQFDVASEQNSDAEVEITVGRNVYWYRIGSDDPIDLRKRGSLRRILRDLLQRSSTESPLSIYELFDVGWPDQMVEPDTATERVTWAIRTLCEHGLRGFVMVADDGYYIPDDLVAVEWREDQLHPPEH